MQSENQETSSNPIQQHFYHISQPEPDEISLVDLLLILVRRRWWIIGTIIVVMAGVVAFLLISKPLYTSHATLQIGQVAKFNGHGKSTPLISKSSLVHKLRARYHIGDKTFGRSKPPKIKSVKAHNGDLINLKAESYSPKQARSYLHNAISKILESQKTRFKHRITQNKNYLKSLRNRRKELESQAENIKKKITSYSKSNKQIHSALTIEQENLLNQISTYQSKISNAKQGMSKPYSRPTHLLVAPTLPKKPISPRTKLILALGVFFALFLGVIMAFGVEFARNANRVIRES